MIYKQYPNNRHAYALYLDGEQRMIARIEFDHERDHSGLIEQLAAAPSLLAALRAALEIVEGEGWLTAGATTEYAKKVSEIEDQIRAALRRLGVPEGVASVDPLNYEGRGEAVKG